mmetsp:Transcript_35943/g.49890  ORF Transcript_35943/g.49890 Transcript_35943/m.49890 type:complete len:413 (+) Transcript_35943:140-1378(+)|eukprot:CAMPEP_0196582436 /NCGR_PEP_ID=MMETSP1081-20130531/38891_1 /TAXON_ID=36882 /ORGANISM="Pyramimonas amylifera, Strain CCMP720" /LENGTH=412 /DNA_ID=CAMNT_0041902991 /DNA_START=122 /DNA_END=1360 /DNA_ORIENTATION=+
MLTTRVSNTLVSGGAERLAKLQACESGKFLSRAEIRSATRASRSHARVLSTSRSAVRSVPLETVSSLADRDFTQEAEEVLTDTFIGNGKEVENFALDCAIKTAALGERNLKLNVDEEVLEAAYQSCNNVTAEYAKTFYLGTKLMTPDKQRAIWAIYVWCRRTDELVDGPNASRITPAALQRWDDRLEQIFKGKPYDMLDAALSDTVQKFPVDIQAFKDMVDGMRMDLVKARYQNYDELYEYCYRVAGTVALMSVPVMGIDPTFEDNKKEIYRAALALGTANQLTNILRDVGEDAERGRVYVPLDDLARFGISDSEIMQNSLVKDGVVDERWKSFMKFQIERARELFKESEEGVGQLDKDARWPVMSALILYSQILDSIEANDYDNFSQRAYVSKWKKIATLPYSYFKSTLKF